MNLREKPALRDLRLSSIRYADNARKNMRILLFIVAISLTGCVHNTKMNSRAQAVENIEKIQRKVLGQPELMQVAKALNRDLFNHQPVKLAILYKFKSTILTDPTYTAVQENSFSNIYYAKFLRAYQFFSQFELVERRDLDRILKEQRLGYSGVLEKSAAEAGEILGTTHVLYVDTTQIKSVEITETGKLIETKTGKVVAAYIYIFDGK